MPSVARIDGKDALGLDLDDSGFNFSVPSKFRARLATGGAERLLMEERLEACRAPWPASPGCPHAGCRIGLAVAGSRRQGVARRTAADLAPSGQRINSLHDPEATFGNTRSIT